ncbi:hypothetical protein [Streptomyces qinglanensis]|uniref:Uncharacterized protein n=1 Tax=Streptomyces qinglanensis TaxID=943816 RepID=A0A1H9QPT4_9ACTN|nr:hypothetical protein [Streptomyces qinglanensis]SER62427.1 hypothetical protein SAMN05421870_10336 [Streptomyces qinglanensis]
MDASTGRFLEELVRWNGELSGPSGNARRSEPTSAVIFRRDHAVAAVEKVTTGLASPGQLSDWAQAVHFEDHVQVEDGHQDLLTRFLVEISTPELFEPVTHEVCQQWLHILRGSRASDTEAAER